MQKGEKGQLDRTDATLLLDCSVTRIPGVSAARASALAGMGISTVRDLITHYPRRYLDLTSTATIAEAPIGSTCTIVAEVADVKLKRPKRGLQLTEIALNDGTATLIATFFRQPWLAKKIHVGDRLAVAGKVTFDYGFKRMANPFKEDAGNVQLCGRVLPIHPASEKANQALMRKLLDAALKQIKGVYDPIPSEIRIRHGLLPRYHALRSIHFPTDIAEADRAKETLVYSELLLLELELMQQNEIRNKDKSAVRHVTDGAKLKALRSSLPFTLTSQQDAAIGDMLDAMGSEDIANHMVLGDVGTGKTVVAAHGMAAAADSGGQSMLLAPTEVLAIQHYGTLGSMLSKAGITVQLLTGSTPKQQREQIISDFAAGDTDVLIGTHALLEDDVCAHSLTLAVIDEQQRFGVNQRAKLLDKGAAPDALYLTATPIPRSLALAIFGNLTLSYLTERPMQRAKRTTAVLAKSSKGAAYDKALEELKAGHQVYVICPLIGVDSESRNKLASKGDTEEESYHPDVSIDDLESYTGDNPSSAMQEASFLQEKVFPDYKVGLMHGSLSSDEKAAVMDGFKSGDIDILVSTTVIEVGVDVPNATVMIIEDADRFGLSQLHQLRGRVGRSGLDSYAFLVSASKREEALARLKALESCDDGFKLAEFDLALRREGDILGNRQSGKTALKLVNVIRDKDLIEKAHADAKEIIGSDPFLEKPEHLALAREIRMTFSDSSSAMGG